MPLPFSSSPSLSHSQEQNAAAAGPRCVWLEDIQALTGETFRTDKKPDPANWEYKSLYRGDIARYPSYLFLSFSGGKSLLSPELSQRCLWRAGHTHPLVDSVGFLSIAKFFRCILSYILK